MFTLLDTFLSPVIVSVQVKACPARLALVVTQSPTLARAVSDYLREKDHNLKVVWLATVADACRRLEYCHADKVVVDSALSESDASLETLHMADPDAEVQVLAGGSASGL